MEKVNHSSNSYEKLHALRPDAKEFQLNILTNNSNHHEEIKGNNVDSKYTEDPGIHSSWNESNLKNFTLQPHSTNKFSESFSVNSESYNNHLFPIGRTEKVENNMDFSPNMSFASPFRNQTQVTPVIHQPTKARPLFTQRLPSQAIMPSYQVPSPIHIPNPSSPMSPAVMRRTSELYGHTSLSSDDLDTLSSRGQQGFHSAKGFNAQLNLPPIFPMQAAPSQYSAHMRSPLPSTQHTMVRSNFGESNSSYYSPAATIGAGSAGAGNKMMHGQQNSYYDESMYPSPSIHSPMVYHQHQQQQQQQHQQQQRNAQYTSSLSPVAPKPMPSPSATPVSADGFIYQVHFKRAHRNFFMSYNAMLSGPPIKTGDFVKVEADRGEDMGVVVSKIASKNFSEFVPTAGYRGRGFSSGLTDKKFILRHATAEERRSLIDKVRDEEKALDVIRQKVVENCLPMVVLDAEYQYDRHKLIFFFEADRRIDFRELVSDLFSLYKTRIWMQQVDTSALPDHEQHIDIARKAGFLAVSYDPIELYNYSDPDVLPGIPPPPPPPVGDQVSTARISHMLLSPVLSPTYFRSAASAAGGGAGTSMSALVTPFSPKYNERMSVSASGSGCVGGSMHTADSSKFNSNSPAAASHTSSKSFSSQLMSPLRHLQYAGVGQHFDNEFEEESTLFFEDLDTPTPFGGTTTDRHAQQSAQLRHTKSVSGEYSDYGGECQQQQYGVGDYDGGEFDHCGQSGGQQSSFFNCSGSGSGSVGGSRYDMPVPPVCRQHSPMLSPIGTGVLRERQQRERGLSTSAAAAEEVTTEGVMYRPSSLLIDDHSSTAISSPHSSHSPHSAQWEQSEHSETFHREGSTLLAIDTPKFVFQHRDSLNSTDSGINNSGGDNSGGNDNDRGNGRGSDEMSRSPQMTNQDEYADDDSNNNKIQGDNSGGYYCGNSSSDLDRAAATAAAKALLESPFSLFGH